MLLLQEKSNNIDDFDYVISIDLGTTYSGSCYSYVRDNKRIVHVIKWPEQSINDTFEKTPTACLYTKDNPPKLIKWGKAAVDYMTAHPEDTNVVFIDKFKLKLHDLFEEFREQVKSQPTTEKNVSDRDYNIHLMAAIDYLRELHQYTCTQLIENEGPTATLDKFRYVLTVPATWVKKDDFSMKSIIAEEAGLITLSKDPSEKVIILSEAHAAALFCEREYCVTQENKSKLHKGQRYLVCDAGGGTVDLSTYECIGTDQKEQKLLKNEHCQLALESGGSCGSTILEHNMEKYLREQIFLGCIEETVLKQLVDQFIKEIKHYFGGGEIDRNNYNRDADMHSLSRATEDFFLESESGATNVEVTTSNSKMMDVVEDDYDYNQDYEDADTAGRNNDDESVDLNQDDDDMDGFNDDDDYDMFDESDEEIIIEQQKPLTVSDYIYFTLPSKGIDSSILENLSLKGSIIENGNIRQLRIEHSIVSKHIFDPIVDQVISLIRKQITKSHTTVDTLFLLGGFGQSPYLYKKIHEEFITSTNAISHLVVPKNGYRASMRGGLYFGLDQGGIISNCTKGLCTNVSSIYYDTYKYLVAIDFNFIDLTANFSIVKSSGGYLADTVKYLKNDFFEAVGTNHTERQNDALFLPFSFDRNRFIQERDDNGLSKFFEEIFVSPTSSNFNIIAACHETIIHQFLYEYIVPAFIKQLFEKIKDTFKTVHSQATWNPETIRYCCCTRNFSPRPSDVDDESNKNTDFLINYTAKSDDDDANFFNTYIDYCVGIYSIVLRVQPKKAGDITESIWKAAEDIGMLHADDHPERLLEVYQYAYGLFIACHQAPDVNYRIEQRRVENLMVHAGVDDSFVRRIGEADFSRMHQISASFRYSLTYLPSTLIRNLDIYSFDLHNDTRLGKVTEINCCQWAPKLVNEYEYSLRFDKLNTSDNWLNVYYDEVYSQDITFDSSGEIFSTVEDLFRYMSLESDFMTKQVRRYIKENVDLSKPLETHRLGDLFMDPTTELPIDDIWYSSPATIYHSTEVYESIIFYADTKITSKTILRSLIVPWIRFRLAPAIMDMCSLHEGQKTSRHVNELYLTFTGEIVETKMHGLSYFPQQDTDAKPITVASFLFEVLKFELERYFDMESWRDIHYNFHYNEENLDKLKHLSCLLYGTSIQLYQTATRVAKRRYAVHFTKYESPGLLKKHTIQQEDHPTEAGVIVQKGFGRNIIELQENNLTLHPIIAKGQTFGDRYCSIDDKLHNFYVKSECYLAVVLYTSEESGFPEYYISNNSFKKLHRFVIPVTHTSVPIVINYQLEDYSILFTVKYSDHYEADFRCNDFFLNID